MPTPCFTGICLISDDVTALAAFYARLFGATIRGDDVFAFVDVDGAGLSIFATPGMEEMAPGSVQGAGRGAFTLEFKVDDVDAFFARVEPMGVTVVKPLTTQTWGRRSVWLRDPDGNIVNLYQQVRRSMPAAKES